MIELNQILTVIDRLKDPESQEQYAEIWAHIGKIKDRVSEMLSEGKEAADDLVSAMAILLEVANYASTGTREIPPVLDDAETMRDVAGWVRMIGGGPDA